MENIAITGETLLVLLGILVTVGGATAVISRWTSPYRTLKKTVERHAQLLDNDNKRIKQLTKDHAKDREKDHETNSVMGVVLLALLDHAITGNSKEKLKATKATLQEHFIRN